MSFVHLKHQARSLQSQDRCIYTLKTLLNWCIWGMCLVVGHYFCFILWKKVSVYFNFLRCHSLHYLGLRMWRLFLPVSDFFLTNQFLTFQAYRWLICFFSREWKSLATLPNMQSRGITSLVSMWLVAKDLCKIWAPRIRAYPIFSKTSTRVTIFKFHCSLNMRHP